MRYRQGCALALLFSSLLAGCSTTSPDLTYSGDARAAVMGGVGVLKDAGMLANSYVRNALSEPLPPWEPAGLGGPASEAGRAHLAIEEVQAPVLAESAQMFAVIPGENASGAPLALEGAYAPPDLENRY